MVRVSFGEFRWIDSEKSSESLEALLMNSITILGSERRRRSPRQAKDVERMQG